MNSGNIQNIDSRCKCTLCKLILVEPQQAECGHRYCGSCIEKIIVSEQRECLACKEEGDSVEILGFTPDKAIDREIAKLDLLCQFAPQCIYTSSLSSLIAHSKLCNFRREKCSQCGMDISHSNLEEHQVSECTKRIINCSLCKAEVIFSQLGEHIKEFCDGNKVACKYCLEKVKDDVEVEDVHLRQDCSVGWHEDNPCPYKCSVDVSNGNMELHRFQNVVKHIDRLAVEVRSNNSHSLNCDVTTVSKLSNDEIIDSEIFTDFDVRLQRLEAVSIASKSMSNLEKESELESHDKMARLSESHSKNFEQMIEEIKKTFRNCSVRIQGYNRLVARATEKKMELEVLYQDLCRTLTYKQVIIHSMEERINDLDAQMNVGSLTWKVEEIKGKRKDAIEGRLTSVYSPAFHTHKYGYKVCARLYLNGDGAGKGSHVSIFFTILRGPYDAVLSWPFKRKVSIMILDQNFKEDVIDAFKPDTNSSSFQRPATNINIASGCPLFMPLHDLENSGKGYVKDDCMFVKVIVDSSDQQ